MTKLYIVDKSGNRDGTWFDKDKAIEIEGNRFVGDALYFTKRGSWVLRDDEGNHTSCTDSFVVQWLSDHNYDERDLKRLGAAFAKSVLRIMHRQSLLEI